MTVHLSAKIEFLETWSIKAGKKHLIDDEDVNVLFLLVVVDVILTLRFIAFIMENEGRLEIFSARTSECIGIITSADILVGNLWMIYTNCFVNLSLEDLEHLTSLRISFTDNHGSDGVVLPHYTELAKVLHDVVKNGADVVLVLDYLVPVDV